MELELMRHAYLFTENLHLCIWGKRNCIILALIRLGAQTNCSDRDAARRANLPENVLRALISACADKNVALAWAAECGFVNLVRIYVRKGEIFTLQMMTLSTARHLMDIFP